MELIAKTAVICIVVSLTALLLQRDTPELALLLTLGAVTVGEPTGQFTSFFHMQSSLDKPVVLPNSQISVMLSNSWWDGDPLVEVQYDENGKLYPWESMILPDVYVYQDIEDIRQGLDSVIEWVLAQ